MHIVIIGNGITGITAAKTIRRLSDHQITVISDESPHFFARTALMYIFLGQLRFQDIKPHEDWFWAENRISLVHDQVTAMNLAEKSLSLNSGATLNFDKLLLATGSKPNFIAWPGRELNGVQGFYSRADLDQLEKTCITAKEAVIVGGGLIGVELAEMLHSRGLKVTMLVREEQYWGRNLPPEEALLIRNRFLKNGIELRLKTELEAISGDEHQQVMAVKTKTGEIIPCQLVCVAIGVKPNLDLAGPSEIKTGKGILVNEYLQTSHPEVYAAGDCAELTFSPNPVEQLWYTGRMQGEIAGYNLCGPKIPYHRGIPFNSAKFFDLEYQTYGAFNTENEAETSSIFWQHPEEKASLRLIFRKDEAKTIAGFVLLGMRFRQEVCETWLRENRPLAYVMQHLKEANFDQEFQRRYEKDILRVYQQQLPEARLPLRKGIFSRLS